MRNPCALVESTRLKHDIRHILDETLRDGDERGFAIVRNNGIHRTRTVIGSGFRINIPMPPKTIATVHTHPGGEFSDVFSHIDINTMLESDLEFAVVAFKKENEPLARAIVPKRFRTFNDLKQHIQETTIVDNTGEFIRQANEELFECETGL